MSILPMPVRRRSFPNFVDTFKGWERADSIVINPHKWLFTPFDLSVLYCKDLGDFERGVFARRRISKNE